MTYCIKPTRYFVISPTKLTKRPKSDASSTACLMLLCQRIKQVIPTLEPELVKFLLIVMSFGDDHGRAFAGYERLGDFKYSSDQVTANFHQLEIRGLLRFVRKGERDPNTGLFLPNVYQFTPALYYLRKSMLTNALALARTQFAPLLVAGQDINRHFNVLSNEVYNQLVKPTPENQDSLTKSSQPIPANQHQNRASKTKNTDAGSNGSVSPDAAAEGRMNQRDLDGKEAGPDQSPKETGETLSRSRTSSTSPQSQNFPSPGSAAPPSYNHREQFGSPLADPDDEHLAAEIASRFKTRRSQMRELVNTHGRDRVLAEYEALVNEMQTLSVEKPAGLLTFRLRKRQMATPGNTAMDWDKLRYVIANEQWNWDGLYRKHYEHYLQRHDCPDWLRAAFEQPLESASPSVGD